MIMIIYHVRMKIVFFFFFLRSFFNYLLVVIICRRGFFASGLGFGWKLQRSEIETIPWGYWAGVRLGHVLLPAEWAAWGARKNHHRSEEQSQYCCSVSLFCIGQQKLFNWYYTDTVSHQFQTPKMTSRF